MMNTVPPPEKIPFFLRPLIALSERITGKTMMPSRLLAWVPSVALASGFLEIAAEKAGNKTGRRLAKLVRARVSFASSCPFCIDINAARPEEAGITAEEMAALRGEIDPGTVASFSLREVLALRYATAVTATPLKIPFSLIEAVRDEFGPRDTVRLAVLAAKVNYWARFSQALGVPAPEPL